MRGAMAIGGSNAHLRQDYEDFIEKHGGEGVDFKLHGKVGLLLKTGAFAPYHEYFYEPGIEPPEEEWKRKQLILKFYETRAANAQGDYEKLRGELCQQAAWAKQFAGHPNAVGPPTEEQIFELGVRCGVAKRFIEDLERVREELGDVQDPRIAAHDAYVEDIRRIADERLDKIAKIQL